MNNYLNVIGLCAALYFLVNMIMDRATHKMEPAYRERERSWFVLRFVVVIIVGGGVVAGGGAFLRGLFGVGTPGNLNCLFPVLLVPGCFVLFKILKGMERAAGEWSDHKARLSRREHSNPTAPLPVMTDAQYEAEKYRINRMEDARARREQLKKLDEYKTEIVERKKRIAEKLFTQSVGKQERRGILKPARMSNAEYFSRIWTPAELYEWMQKNGGGWE